MNKRWGFIAMLFIAALALAGCGQSVGRLNSEGNEAFAEQDYQGALTAYQQAQEQAPQVAEPHYNAANTYYRTDDYEQAQQEIEQALVGEQQQKGLDQDSYYNLGNVLFQSGQYEAAIEAYKEALRLDPTDLQAKQNLELALRQLQQQDQQNDQQQPDDQQPDDQQQESQQDDQQQDGQQDDQQQDGQQDDQQQDGQQDDQQQDSQQDEQQQDGQQDEQQQDGQQDEQQQDGQQDDQQQDGQQDEQQQDGQAGSQPGQIVGLTKEQARQLFEAAAEGAESLEEFLQQILIFPGAPPREDW